MSGLSEIVNLLTVQRLVQETLCEELSEIFDDLEDLCITILGQYNNVQRTALSPLHKTPGETKRPSLFLHTPRTASSLTSFTENLAYRLVIWWVMVKYLWILVVPKTLLFVHQTLNL